MVGECASAVVAMQYVVDDDAAMRFSRTFYRGLATGLAVDEAVMNGRHHLMGMGLRCRPSLYVGTKRSALRLQLSAAGVEARSHDRGSTVRPQ